MNSSDRKATDILIALEEKVLLLTKVVAANDMNNKLILDRLNKLLLISSGTQTPISNVQKSSEVTQDRISVSGAPPLEISDTPTTVSRRQSIPDDKPLSSDKNLSRIPVGQRITDSNGKDLFMADVVITNVVTNEILNKSKTNAVGKWQAYLPIGKYAVHVIKTDHSTMNKIESLQEIEITPQMKSLQLPVAIIKR